MAALLFTTHSMVRYLVLAAALATLVVALLGLRRATPSKSERVLMLAFVGLVDLQVLLGVLLLLVFPFYGQLIGHLVMMTLAAVAAHAGTVMARRREPARSGSGARAITVGVVLVLIVGGIMAIQRPIL
jgi:FtsH-binding integral membrane protein